MNVKKPGLLLPIILLSIITSQAQRFEWISNEFPGSLVMDVVEANNKVYAIVSNTLTPEYFPNQEYKLSLYELNFSNSDDPAFEAVESKSLTFDGEYSTLAIEYVEETQKWLLVQLGYLPDNRLEFRVLLCDPDFNIIKQQTIDTAGYPIPFHIDSYNGKTYVLGSILGPPKTQLFYLKYSHEQPDSLPPIVLKQSEPKPMFWVTSMRVDPRTGNLLVFYYEGIAVLDSNLHQVHNYNSFSQIATNDHGDVLGDGEYYYSHGADEFPMEGGIRRLVLHKYDTSFTIIKADSLGFLHQDNYPFYVKSIDRRNDQLLIGGHLDGPFNHIFVQDFVKKFYLAKYDEDINRIWYKEYGGDKAYWFAGLHLINDGSCLAYGFITDTTTLTRYGYIFHVTSDGDYITSYIIPPSNDNVDLIQVVSPGQDNLQILNPKRLLAQVSLFDIIGNHLFEKTFNEETTTISLAEFPAGSYPYLISINKKIIKSGTWFKI